MTAAPETMLSQTDLADKSGDFFADFAVLPSHDFGGYLTGDYLLNLRSLPFTDYTAPYFDRQAMSQFTFRGVMYAAVGEATVQPEDDLCLFFNRDLAETTGFRFDSESVEWGTFTWDLLLTALSAATDPEDGTYVRFVSRFDAPLTAAFACSSAGVTFLAPDANGLLRQSVNTDAGRAMLETMKSFLPHLTVPEEDPFAVFAGGRALLAIGTLSDVEKLGTAGFRWELLPFPKAVETAEYVTPVTTNAPVVTALSSSVNIDITGYVLQAVNAASAGRFLPVYEAILLRDYVTEAKTLDRIDLICHRTAADTALSFGSVKAVREGTYQAFYEAALGTKTLAKALSAKKKALTQYLDQLG